MSRIGRAPITIPDGVMVSIEKGGQYDNQVVKVSGPKGELSQDIRQPITAKIEDGIVTVARPNDVKQNKALHGLYRALIANMVKGVTEGYKVELEIVGIGYRAEQQGEKTVFSLGFAHKIDIVPPAGITITVDDATKVKIEGADKELVGRTAAQIHELRPPEPYKGKGVRYKGEQILRKSSKSA